MSNSLLVVFQLRPVAGTRNALPRNAGVSFERATPSA
jgi:hypothetical protein